MTAPSATIKRPQRWDEPFGGGLDEDAIDRVLAVAPFSDIDPEAFPAALPLRDILANDARLVTLEPGDLVVREGDYGSSLFYILDGAVEVVLDALPPSWLGRRTPPRRSLPRILGQIFNTGRVPEARDLDAYRDIRGARGVAGVGVMGGMGRRQPNDGTTRVFLQDWPQVVADRKTARLETGAFFGELSALTRMPRTATVLAAAPTVCLEMRWQGLRDLRRRSPAIRDHVDRLYRERSLLNHLRATPLFAGLEEAALSDIADHVDFETFGEFDWYDAFRRTSTLTAAERLAREPVIAEAGHYPNGVILVRAGFARRTAPYGTGDRTVSYVGRGHVFGGEEILETWRSGRHVPLRHTLRAVGYVDILRVPTKIVEQYVLNRPDSPRRIPALEDAAADTPRLDTTSLEFLTDHRYMNGTKAMVIDMNRCTGCDDCVRACASTHDGNPRFVRHGPEIGHHMIANACMHCVDPVCMIGCPTGAIHRDAVGGEVVINDRTCIGCGTCAGSCPYQNIRMVEIRDRDGEFVRDEAGGVIQKATKCDLCADQLGGPACQRACPHDALVRLDLSDAVATAKRLAT